MNNHGAYFVAYVVPATGLFSGFPFLVTFSKATFSCGKVKGPILSSALLLQERNLIGREIKFFKFLKISKSCSVEMVKITILVRRGGVVGGGGGREENGVPR